MSNARACQPAIREYRGECRGSFCFSTRLNLNTPRIVNLLLGSQQLRSVSRLINWPAVIYCCSQQRVEQRCCLIKRGRDGGETGERPGRDREGDGGKGNFYSPGLRKARGKYARLCCCQCFSTSACGQFPLSDCVYLVDENCARTSICREIVLHRDYNSELLYNARVREIV